MNIIKERLTQLRELMAKENCDIYIVPGRDAHNNEYMPDCWQRRAWISGFTGSAGDVIVTQSTAYLWTDGRYFLQAEQQLDTALFQIMKSQHNDTPTIEQWLSQVGEKKVCLIDPQVVSITQAQRWQQALIKAGSELKALEDNLIDRIWQDQPALPNTPIHLHALEYAGKNSPDKQTTLRQLLTEKAEIHIITHLDAIAWLFNIRGNDIAYNPMAISYAIISQSEATLFIDPDKIAKNDLLQLQDQRIAIKSYNEFKKSLALITDSVLLDPNQASWWVLQQLTQATPAYAPSPIDMLKACKNPVEQNGMREAHRRDAIAMVKFFYWLENNWQQGLDEIAAAEQLEIFRRHDPHCVDLSFATISAFAEHGAIVHYSATPATNQMVNDNQLYLIDSGGQYYEGTTDITRTIHLGTPTDQQKNHYTLVLKGHLALRHAIFPKGTCGEQLDVLARSPLWQIGLNFGHGTGHGVGSYLCVHEGPQRISPIYTGIALQEGMVVSNEPGVYLTNQYGIRIENLCLVQKATLPASTNFLTFTDLTLVPYAQNLIDRTQLSKQEIEWINEYHAQIYEKIEPDLTDSERQWLQQITSPL